jgi:hypothetical protein
VHLKQQQKIANIQLLNKGLKYNLHHKNKKRVETLAPEVETAINIIDIREQNYYRQAVAKKINDINSNSKVNNNRKNKEQRKLIINVKNKICKNKLVVTQADKAKTLVILTEEAYKHIIRNCIQDNHFTMINKDPTQQYHKIVKQTLKQCNIIQKEHR